MMDEPKLFLVVLQFQQVFTTTTLVLIIDLRRELLEYVFMSKFCTRYFNNFQ